MLSKHCKYLNGLWGYLWFDSDPVAMLLKYRSGELIRRKPNSQLQKKKKRQIPVNQDQIIESHWSV